LVEFAYFLIDDEILGTICDIPYSPLFAIRLWNLSYWFSRLAKNCFLQQSEQSF
jgi:hypothetical protein